MSIGSRIRSAREAKGLTQAQLAEKVGNIETRANMLYNKLTEY
jgi:transcriptional regulator with XRE-family HTH domain